jgi:UDPglucose 6-dehydrogenase
LVTGACLAEMGNDVLCMDVDVEKIKLLNDGGIPIYEPGLRELVERNLIAKRLSFTTDVRESVGHGLLQFIAVGTPPDEDGSADLKYVISVAQSIGQYMTEYKVVIDKSTVPVGTSDKVRLTIRRELELRNRLDDFSVVSNPEFLKEGAAIDDFMRPDRIVIGVSDSKADELMREVYAPFVRNHDRLMVMDIRSAELTKYAANAMLATRISFMNELANLAESVGADIEAVRLGIGSDSRIGYPFLYAGCGYGGSCFPKDVKALIGTGKEYGYSLGILEAVDIANENQKMILSKKVKNKFGVDLSGRHFSVWGLSFKPQTDDMRDAPSLNVINDLISSGATVSAYDPVAMSAAMKIYAGDSRVSFCENQLDACADADALLIVTEWKEFQSPNFTQIIKRLKTPIIFDGRNIFDPPAMSEMGFDYNPIGRGI